MRFEPPTYAILGVIILLVGAVGLGAYAVFSADAVSQIFRFISLIILVIAALSITAMVFFGLGMGNREEAFGLPAGSIRSLLAIGIMVLFVVFGLPLVNPPPDVAPRLSDQPLATAAVARNELAAAVEQHRAQGLVVIVADYGRAPAAGAPADAGTPARIEVYEKIRARPSEELEIARQLLTAIVTLLTTVVGFYFGSRSAGEGLKEAEAARRAAVDTAKAMTPPKQAP